MKTRVLNRFAATVILVLLFLAMPGQSATITFTNDYGYWDDPSNWSPNQVPGATDSAIVTNYIAVYLESPVTVGNLDLKTGIYGSNLLTVLSNFYCAGSVIDCPVLISSNGVLNIDLDETLPVVDIYQVLTNAGTVNWDGSPIYLYDQGGIVNLTGGVFNAQGNMEMHSSGGGFFNNAGQFINLPSFYGGTTIDVAFTNTGTVDTASGYVVFNGAFVSSDGVIRNEDWGVEFDGEATINGGTVCSNALFSGKLTGDNVIRGSLSFENMAVLGTLTVATNGVLDATQESGELDLYGVLTNAGIMNWSGYPISVYAGGGIVNLTGGTVNVLNDRYPTMTSHGGGFFNNAGKFINSFSHYGEATIDVNFTNTGTVDLGHGYVTFNGAFVSSDGMISGQVVPGFDFEGGATINGGTVCSNAWVYGNLTGDNLIHGSLSFYNMVVTGTLTIATDGVLDPTQSSWALDLYGVLTNAGTVNWSSYPISVHAGGGIVNRAGGVFNVQGNVEMYSYGGGFFNNAGTFINSSSIGGGATIDVAFTNTGTIQVAASYMWLQGPFFGDGGTLRLVLNPGSSTGDINFGNPVDLATVGTLKAYLKDGFLRPADDYFVLLTYPSAIGHLARLILPPQAQWQTITYTSVYEIQAGAANPASASLYQNADGTFTLTAFGLSSGTNVVQTTTNLSQSNSWLPIFTNTGSSGAYWEFTDTAATNYPQRFYRVLPGQ